MALCYFLAAKRKLLDSLSGRSSFRFDMSNPTIC